MKKKSVFVLAAILFLCVFTILNMVSLYFFSVPFSPVAITGRVTDTSLGIVRLYVEGKPRVINISSPLNSTYTSDNYTCATGTLPKCNNYRYVVDLNVSADFFVEPVDGWKYSLYDLKHDVYLEEDTFFDPNSTISASRWGNLLTVYADDQTSSWRDQEVTFYVEVANSSPIIGPINETIFVCEATRLDYRFNASDVDEEFLSADFSPKNLTFQIDNLGKSGDNVTLFKLYSGLISKSKVDNYNKTISVTDLTYLSDYTVTNISVIEINNPPKIYIDGVENILGLRAQTVYLQGANSSFNYQWDIRDIENGNTAEGNLTFNISWGGVELFSINSTTGVVNYTPISGHQGVDSSEYHVKVCVNDTALATTHENISLCAPRSGNIESVCDSFVLIVTNDNRPPVIVRNSPSTTDFGVDGTTNVVFNASVYDDDMVGAYPDLDWYVNGVLQESNENKSSDTYGFTAGCEVAGIYNVTAVTSDGPLNASISWNVTVASVPCPVDSGSGGGGGGSGGGSLSGYCRENWVCTDWQVCQNVERSFVAKSLSPEDYFGLKEICAQNQYDDRFCGFQLTNCQDLELCNNTEPKLPRPAEMKACYFTENPNCIDGITNCHDGGCELLVDCGGPCSPCPTCSDGKRNQGEQGVDCGGPCPYGCDVEEAFRGISFVIIGLLVIAVIVFVFILIKVISIIRYHFFVGKKRKKKRKV